MPVATFPLFSFTVYLLCKVMGFITNFFLFSVLYSDHIQCSLYFFCPLSLWLVFLFPNTSPLLISKNIQHRIYIYILGLQATCLPYLFFKMFVVATGNVTLALWLTSYFSLTGLLSTKSLLRLIQLVGYLCKQHFIETKPHHWIMHCLW